MFVFVVAVLTLLHVADAQFNLNNFTLNLIGCQTCSNWEAGFNPSDYGPGAHCHSAIISPSQPLRIPIKSDLWMYSSWSGAYQESTGSVTMMRLETNTGDVVVSGGGADCSSLDANLPRSALAQLGPNYVLKVSCQMSVACAVTLSYKIRNDTLCYPGCYPYMLGNDICDPECDLDICNRDNGDCAVGRAATSSSGSRSAVAVLVPILIWIAFVVCILARCRRTCRNRLQRGLPTEAALQPATGAQVPPNTMYGSASSASTGAAVHTSYISMPAYQQYVAAPPPPYVQGQALPPPPPLP